MNSDIFCVKCGLKKENRFCLSCNEETRNLHKVEVSDTVFAKESIRVKGKRSRNKRPFVEILTGWFPSRKYEHGVELTREIDRDGNRYKEVIHDSGTGVLVRNCHEPLDEHHNHKK